MLVERKSEALTMLGRLGQFSHSNIEYLQLWIDGFCAGFAKRFYIFKILALMAPGPVTAGGPCQCLFTAGSLHSGFWECLCPVLITDLRHPFGALP